MGVVGPAFELSGRIKRVGYRTVLLCDQFPLAGLGANGSEALGTFFASLRVFVRYSDRPRGTLGALNKLGYSDDDAVMFSLGIPGQSVSARIEEVLRGGQRMFVASCNEYPVKAEATGFFDAVTGILDGMYSHFREREDLSHFGRALQKHMASEDNEARFFLRSHNLSDLIMDESLDRQPILTTRGARVLEAVKGRASRGK